MRASATRRGAGLSMIRSRSKPPGLPSVKPRSLQTASLQRDRRKTEKDATTVEETMLPVIAQIRRNRKQSRQPAVRKVGKAVDKGRLAIEARTNPRVSSFATNSLLGSVRMGRIASTVMIRVSCRSSSLLSCQRLCFRRRRKCS